jgi:Flp pilus assembly protein TadG
MIGKRYNRGQSLLEFALAIPLLLLMVTVFIDVGRAIFTYSELANAVREGTRYAIVHNTDTEEELSEVEDIVLHYSPMLNPDDMEITITPPSEPSNVINISVTYIYRPITPGLSSILSGVNSINFEAHSSALVAPLYQ